MAILYYFLYYDCNDHYTIRARLHKTISGSFVTLRLRLIMVRYQMVFIKILTLKVVILTLKVVQFEVLPVQGNNIPR